MYLIKKFLTRIAFNAFNFSKSLAVQFLNRGSQVDYRRRLNVLFKIREKIFFRKKAPESETYPFFLIDPFEVFGEESPYGDFNLLGEDWKNKTSTKPVAILWGFNNWKWGFVSDYLPEYRTAFAPRKMVSSTSLIALRRFPVKPSAFIFWGYTESWVVRNYAKWHNIKIFRMEDGFIRSSALGASHSTPYSLVLDSEGLHYNPEEPSGLEEIINKHDFSDRELRVANECMDLMKSLRLSKYNPAAILGDRQSGVKVRKRVAVLGQVDNDMSVRLGNPDGWSMIELIRLAKIENPDADIFYRPHPDIYMGFQRSRFRQRAVEKYCKLASPEVPLVDFLDTVDHVYTVTSLSGLEALLKGIKVTVVGAAFYAGWGLTDDRVNFPRRTRSRSLLELFAAVYMKYPRYLADISDSGIGFKAACYRIVADREVESSVMADKHLVDGFSPEIIARSKFWPKLFFGRGSAAVESKGSDWLRAVDFANFLSGNVSANFQKIFVLSVCGKLPSNAARDQFIVSIRRFIDIHVLNDVVLILSRYHPGNYIYNHLAWMLSEVKDNDPAVEVLSRRFRVLGLKQGDADADPSAEKNTDADSVGPDNKIEVSAEQREILFSLMDASLGRKDYKGAVSVAETILVTGGGSYSLLIKIAKVFELIFDCSASSQLARFCQAIDVFGENRRGVVCELNNFPTSPSESDLERLKSVMSVDVKLSPERVILSLSMAKKYIGKDFKKVIEAMLLLGGDFGVNKAMAFLEVGKPELAKSILEKSFLFGEESDKSRVVYSRVLSTLGRYGDALDVMRGAMARGITELNARESLRILTYLGRFDQADILLQRAADKKVYMSDSVVAAVHLGHLNVEEGYKSYIKIPFRDDMICYFKGKYKKSNDLNVNGLLMLAGYGPGDEIRFSSLYPDFVKAFGLGAFSVTCDYRLERVFKRSFPGIQFVPVRRVRDYSFNYPRSDYSSLPGADLCSVLDSRSLSSVDSAKEIAMVTDYIWHFRKSRTDFPGEAVLVCDEGIRQRLSASLPRGKLLVGISWRSSLVTNSRNESYLSVEELGPLFALDGVQFVNFQYDDCGDELRWVEDNFPGKLLDLDQVDHFDDLESVASLMKCMDLIIAPATTVIELAGAVGCRAWLISNSAELHWRKTTPDGVDVWFNSIRHMEGSRVGDKSGIVARMREELLKELC